MISARVGGRSNSTDEAGPGRRRFGINPAFACRAFGESRDKPRVRGESPRARLGSSSPRYRTRPPGAFASTARQNRADGALAPVLHLASTSSITRHGKIGSDAAITQARDLVEDLCNPVTHAALVRIQFLAGGGKPFQRLLQHPFQLTISDCSHGSEGRREVVRTQDGNPKIFMGRFLNRGRIISDGRGVADKRTFDRVVLVRNRAGRNPVFPKLPRRSRDLAPRSISNLHVRDARCP